MAMAMRFGQLHASPTMDGLFAARVRMLCMRKPLGSSPRSPPLLSTVTNQLCIIVEVQLLTPALSPEQVFLLKAAVNLTATMLDTPEFFWRAPDQLQVGRACDFVSRV